MRNARVWLAAGIVAVTGVAGTYEWNAAHHAAGDPTPSSAPEVQLATAQRGAIDVIVYGVGRVGASAGAQSKLAFPLSGRLAAVHVHVGQAVNAGDALAALDATNLTLAEQQAQADAVAARAQAQAAAVDKGTTRLAVDRAALARTQRLYAAGIDARKDVEAALAQVAADVADNRVAAADRNAAQAQASSADARAALAHLDASNTTLRAPTSGVVTAIYRNAGESVDPTVPVIAIAPRETGAVTLQVAGSDAAKIASGDSATLRVDGTNAQIDGTVAGVASAIDPTTQSAEVSVRTGAPLPMPGSSVNAQIIVAHNRGLLIPRNAIIADPETGNTIVFVATKGKDGSNAFAERRINVVYQNDTSAEVTGLRAGERVAARGAFELLQPAAGN